ncbi:MAG: CRISPR-associated helicase Cas3' [Bacteroidetes bacterium]|nr:CRISPR-associated helicase Cas3' [Bacteroidota bacterium]
MKILAKSNPETTLQEHINDALVVAEILKDSFTYFSKIINEKYFWKPLRISIIFHDLGKSHKEFQNVLQGKTNKWSYQRHELFSLPFFKALNIEDKDLIYKIVAGHHKDFKTLIQKLNEYGDDTTTGLNLDSINKIPTFEDEFKKNIPVNDVLSLLKEYNINLTGASIHNPINILQQYIRNKETNNNKRIRLLLLTGAFKQCDHLASAGIKRINKLDVKDFDFLYKSDFKFYNHQLKASKLIGNSILTAPTGSGKTEASLLWLRNQIQKNGNGHVFYILPFTASINAMFERLENKIPKKIGLVHGKLSAFIENKFEDDDLVDDNQKTQIKEQFKNLVTPFKVVTPFQLLKHIFAIRGFEKGIFEWAGGYFIFDEIHAYNPQVFAQIIVLLQFATSLLGVKTFIMTATLPTFLRKELEKAIGYHTTIIADKKLFRDFKRHRIVLKQDKLNENYKLIQTHLNKGEKVLVVCNTVKQSQLVYKNLISKNKVLLHSSFNAEDRNRKENLLFDKKIKLLVGTQAIEVSLDINFDILFTEPAPLDALIQRFGRINRKHDKGISDCVIFQGRNKADKFVYKNEEIINRTISILKEKQNINSGEISEDDLQNMIDFVYPNWDENSKEEFNKIYTLLNGFVKNELRPFIYNEKQEEDFYKQFDGVKVLPVKFYSRYKKYLQENKFIKAENLKVQISEKRYYSLNANQSLETDRDVFESIKTGKLLEQKVLIIYKKYDTELGLLIDEDEKDASSNGWEWL